MTIRWSTLVAGDDGAVDMSRLRSTAGVILALLGGVLMVVVTLVSLLTTATIDLTLYGIMVGGLVLPLTGGKIADSLTGRSLSSKFLAWKAPDRRSSGSQPQPPEP